MQQLRTNRCLPGPWSLALTLAMLFASSGATATTQTIPATRLMTVYQFSGPLEIPFYDGRTFRPGDRSNQPSGLIAQGSAVTPCVFLRNGKPLTDSNGTPYVGFDVLFDARSAKPGDADRFAEAAAARKQLTVQHHHCDASARNVMDARYLYALDKKPHFAFSATASAATQQPATSAVDGIVKAFHDSPQCASINRHLTERRAALERAWDNFTRINAKQWSPHLTERAKQLDYVMRTALYEGHLDRGCNAYGACERNAIVLSIRNRALEKCREAQGCRFPGDFQGVSSKPNQYNIWDEYLLQSSGITSCFLAKDSGAGRLQKMYQQSVKDAVSLMFDGHRGLNRVFSGQSLQDLKQVRHYYHPPAMGSCFPNHKRIEYISGAIARNGTRHALIVNTRIGVESAHQGGYLFRSARIDKTGPTDVIALSDDYHAFVIDARKIALRAPRRCAPFGTPSGCGFRNVGRYRKTPSWISDGKPLQLTCRVQATGADCSDPVQPVTARVGGKCDIEMQPFAGVR